MRSPTAYQSVTQDIFQHLGEAIVTGKYDNAPFPTELNLSLQYGAARSITREAVKMLISKGLLTSRPRWGTRVESEDHWNLLDPDVLHWLLERKFCLNLLIEFTEIRLSVEPAGAALAARKATLGERTAISRSVERMLASEKGEDDLLETVIAFHVAVMRASGNRFYKQFCEMIEIALRFDLRKRNDFVADRPTFLMKHKLVADAIVSGHPTEAERRMRDLIQECLDVMTSPTTCPTLTSTPSF